MNTKAKLCLATQELGANGSVVNKSNKYTDFRMGHGTTKLLIKQI